jgi:polyisoprenyl-teichoic acid--peptidoglycan teichoic acid transferase
VIGSIHARVTRILLAVIAVVLVAASCTGGRSDGSPGAHPSPAAPTPLPSTGPDTASYELTVDVRSVEAESVAGTVRPRDVAGPVEAIRRTIGELYTIGFVDPFLWDGGEFPSLFRLFAADVRDQASRDVAQLTLGPAARLVDAVRPRPARLDVRLITDAQDRALAAVAHVRFIGTAEAGELRAPVTHEGDYVLRRLNGAWRVVSYDVRGRVPEDSELDGEATSADLVPSLLPRGPMFFLVIGSDARPGQPVSQTRADSIHVVGVNPRKGRVSILGIPRDSWVPIPGWGTDKINAALVVGGPELLVATVEHLTGIQLDAYVLTGFEDFQTMVSAVGGFDIRIPYPISDSYARAQFRKGPEHLSGREALAFSRVRHDLPTGDFGRSFNQGRVMIAALATLRDEVADGSAALLPWVIAGAAHLKTDLSIGEMFELLMAAPAFEPTRVRNAVVSGHTGSVGSKSVVFLDGGAYAMFRDLGRDAILG